MFSRPKILIVLLAVFFVAGQLRAEDEKPMAPVLEGMGKLHHPVSTKNEKAQQFFDQGLTLSYGFNHKEAERSFREAARLDPDLAMAYWGIALVLGPNYNTQMEDADVPPAYEAMQKALKLAPGANEKDRAFIHALSMRYVLHPPEDRSPLDQKYSAAMRDLAASYPDDPDASALFAESLMDLHPWDLWTREGEPKEWTAEILQVLEQGMQKWPDHPGFHHFYIHAVEASAHPERALKSAQKLPDLVPGAGHLVHMPAHIYIRTGQYLESVKANEEAILVDDAYITQCRKQELYPLGYAPHNHHFLAASAMLAGQSEKSISASRHLAVHQDPQMMRDPQFGCTLQHFWVTPIYALVRFGKWDALLKEPKPDKDLLYPIGVWHYGRGMAYLRKGKTAEAKAELEEVRKLVNDPEVAKLTIWGLNSIKDVLIIAEEVLAGEIAAEEKDFETAIAHLEKGVTIEDSLLYQEPADWNASVRQNLGAVLLAAGRPAEAEKVYRKDLQLVPENGWSLYGLAQALHAQGKDAEAQKVESRFQKSWSQADVKLASSRF